MSIISNTISAPGAPEYSSNEPLRLTETSGNSDRI
jgi:hypothetical protein